MEKTLNYIAFVIGYEFRDSFSNEPEADLVYEKCMQLAKEVVDSEYFADKSISTYDAAMKYMEMLEMACS